MFCPIVTDCLGFQFPPYLNVILVMIACSTVGVYSFCCNHNKVVSLSHVTNKKECHLSDIIWL